ncbi:MAG: hypothetical protein LAQ69_42680 [Acidobacteriia bacterium]|nr:hypothetical protein [Terriglobia bacterium]
MFLRAVVVWCALLASAVGNGAAREIWITPKLGDRVGHALSTIGLCTLILVVSWLTIGWVGPAGRADALMIGGLWLFLTLGFEFLAGHYLFGKPWGDLTADYNLLRGRIWVLVLVTTAVAPVVTGCGRRLWGAA